MVQRDRQVGDKLLPKIMEGVIQSVIATKTGLTGHEFNLKVNVGQELIDRMGREAAELGRPIIRAALDREGANIHPLIRDYLESAASGEDQIKAIGGILLGGASSSLSSVISNVLAPVAYAINSADPSLSIDPSTIAAAYAAGLDSYDDAVSVIRQYGYSESPADILLKLAQTIPSVPDLNEFWNRGLMNTAEYENWVRRAGYDPAIVGLYAGTRRNIITVQDAALAVLRSDITKDTGYAIANQNGFTNESFDILLANTGEPPGPQELSEALRRGFIDEARFTRGIEQSRVRNEWVSTLLALRYEPITTADAVNAHVEGYVSEETVKSIADQNGLEPGQYKVLVDAAGDPLSYTDMMRLWRYGKATKADVEAALRRGRLKDNYIDFALALKDSPMSVADAIEASIQGYLSKDAAKAITLMNGLREEDFEPLWHTAGAPASRTEMIELWQRGEVTEQDVINALKQSRLKDSYIPDVLKLKVRLPALYEIRALLASGGISAKQGTQILLAQGYTADIVHGIVSAAIGEATAPHKALTESMYASLYREHAISSEQFITALKLLGYSQIDSKLIQEIADNQIAVTQRDSVISAVKKAYVSHRINESSAQSELNQLGLPAVMVEQLIADWDLIIETEIRLLTPAQVVDAWFIGLFDPGSTADNTTQALDYLANLGYSSGDAVILLEIKAKGPLTSGSQGKQVSTSASTGGATGSTGA